MATKVKLGTIYMDNEILNPNITTSYRQGSFISIDTNNKDENNVMEWVKVDYGSKHYLISTHNILNNISYNELNLQGLIKGVEVTLDGTKYILRVLKGGNTSRINGDKYSKGNPDNEWDDIICNEIGLTDLPIPNTKDLTGLWTDSDISQSDNNNLWNWYKKQSFCQEINSNNCTIRGGNSVVYFETVGNTIKNSNLGWRPILEKYNYNPIVSDSDRNIGNYTMNIVKKYNVIDPDGEIMEVKEYIDNELLRTYPNVLSGTELQLSLSTKWSSLSNSSHTIKIEVTDTFGNKAIRLWTFNKLSPDSGDSSITLMKPSIIVNSNTGQVNPIDATQNNTIEFNVIGGDMVYHNELCITDNEDNITIVYDRKNTSFDFKHNIPANSLINGKEYQLKIRTYDENNKYSQWSDIVLMRTASPIDLTINNIVDGKINTQNPLFVATYTQSENIKVSSFRYVLYKNGMIIDKSDEIFGENIQYQFNNLENKEYYTIQLTVKNVNGQEKTIIQDFYCSYIQTRLNAILKSSINKKEGSVLLETYVRQIIGYLISGDKVTYINEEEADLHNSLIRYDEDNCFYLENDWTMQLWARDLEDNTDLIKIYNRYGYIILSKYKNIFYISSYLNSGEKIYERYYTINGDIYSTDNFYFYIQYSSKNGFFNFKVKRVNIDRQTWFVKSHENDNIPTYYKENGFLTNISNNMKNIIINKDNSLFRLPKIEDLIGDNKLDLFKTESIKCKYENNYTAYFTNSYSDEKLIAINENGIQFITNANDIIGNRYLIDIPLNTLVSKSKYINYYSIKYVTSNKIKTTEIKNLKVGDVVKDYRTTYKNIPIKFTIANISNDRVTLITDILCLKEFDSSETNKINGNNNWSLSNLRQWLNNNYILSNN